MIQLTENLAVIADELQYIVGKPVERERNGQPVVCWRTPRYYPTLAGGVGVAVSPAMGYKGAGEEITTLRAFLTEYRRLDDEFRRLLEPLE